MRTTVFNEKFENLDAWTHRDVSFAVTRQKYMTGVEEAVWTDGEGLHLGVVPLGLAEDGERQYGYGHIGTLTSCEVLPGDIVSARVRFNPYRGNHGSPWLQSRTPYGNPNDYEIDFEHFGARNPWRKAGVDLHQNLYWRAPGQPFGQTTGIQLETNSNTILPSPDGPRALLGEPWSEELRTYTMKVGRKAVTFLVDGVALNQIPFPNGEPRPMFICLSNIARDFEHEDLEESFVRDPVNGPGVMTVQRVWVTRNVG